MAESSSEQIFSRAAVLMGFSEFAHKRGLNPSELFRHAGIAPDIEARPEDILAYIQWGTLLRGSAEQACDPLFGLRYGLFQGPSVLGPLFYLICNAHTVGEALQELSDDLPVHSGWGKVHIELHPPDAMICYEAAELGDLGGLRQNIEQAVGIGMQLLRLLIGRNWLPRGIELQHAAPCESIHYRRLLGVAPTFNSRYNCIRFDAAALQQPLTSASKSLHALMQTHVRNMERLTPKELPYQVQQLLLQLLPTGRASINRVASYLLVSARTLQRQLADEGTSFQILLDDTRQSMAQRYLSASAISMTQLAEMLGYADLSAFSRAFQRWFKLSPRAWQKQQRKQPEAVLSP